MFQTVLKMTKSQNILFFVVMFSLGAFFVGTAFAAEETVKEAFSESVYSFEDGGLQLYQFEDKDKKLTLGGEIITRYAYWNWFEALSDNNEYSYGFSEDTP